ncbi:MAG TPA: hypothetical protein VH744_02225 [Terriglobales bacterium]
MTLASVLWYYLLIAPHVLLLGIVVALLRQRLYRSFPIFLAYTAYEIVLFGVALVMILSPAATGSHYAATYAIGTAGSTVLRFGIIHEVFAHLFRNYSAIMYLGKPIFRWATVGTLLAALSLAVYTGGNDLDRLMLVVRLLDRTASILQCGLLVGLFLFASYLGLSWRNHVFGIALGLGIFASVELAASAIRSHTGFEYNALLNYVTMATYHVCVLIWLFYLWVPERSPQYAVKTLPEHDLETWNNELRRLIQQ